MTDMLHPPLSDSIFPVTTPNHPDSDLALLNHAPHDDGNLHPNHHRRLSPVFRRKSPTDNTARPEVATAEPEDPGYKRFNLSQVSLNLRQKLTHKMAPTDNVTHNEATTAEAKPPYVNKHHSNSTHSFNRLFSIFSKKASINTTRLETTPVAPTRTNDLPNPTESLPRRTSSPLLKRHSTGNTEGEGSIVPGSSPIFLDAFTAEPQEDGSATSPHSAGISSSLPKITISPPNHEHKTPAPGQSRRSLSIHIRKQSSFNSVTTIGSNFSTSGESSTDKANTQHKNRAWKDNRDCAWGNIAAKEEELKSNELKFRTDAENLRRNNSIHLSQGVGMRNGQL